MPFPVQIMPFVMHFVRTNVVLVTTTISIFTLSAVVANKLFCLDDIVTPDLHLPKGYQSQEIDVLVKGTCKQCSAPSKRA